MPALKKRLADGKKLPPHLQMRFACSLWKIARDPDAAKLLRTLIEQNAISASLEQKLWRIDSGADTIATLEKQLKSEKPEAVIGAAAALGTKSKEAIPALAKALTDKEARVRAQAVIALVQLGSQAKDTLPALRNAMKDDAAQIAFWATVAVCRLDPTAETVAAIASYLGDPNPVIREDAVVVLGSLGATAKPAVPKLTVLLNEAGHYAKLAAAVALWKIEQHPLALPAVVELLQSPDRRVREQAAVEIGGTFGPDARSATSAIVKRLFDPFAAVRSTSAEAIGRVGPGASKAAPALLALLEGDEPAFVQSAACEALGLIDPLDKDGVVAVLKKKLEHYDPLVRVHAALALHRLNGDKAGEKIADRLLGYRTHQVRITAAEALWGMSKDERVVPLLVRTLEESNLDGLSGENERYMAVRALGRIGTAGKPAVPELLKLLEHPDAALAATARTALKALDPEAAKKAGVP
ncbi:MAG: HEAT repeat domain-containing protein [Gemmataceae bacterium]